MSCSCWYAITTKSRHEKVVADQLQRKSVETFLPLLTSSSRWKDRNVMIDRPIFPGYVFLRVDLKERNLIYNVPGVVRMLAFGGVPAQIDDAEIEGVRLCLTRGQKPEACQFLETGERVRVNSGPLKGLEGIVTRRKNQYRIVVSIALIHQSITAEVEAQQLESLETFPQDQSAFQLCEA